MNRADKIYLTEYLRQLIFGLLLLVLTVPVMAQRSESGKTTYQAISESTLTVSDNKEKLSIENYVSEVAPIKGEEKWYNNFALSTNLLAYALILPNIEIDWNFAHRWSAALEYQGMWIGKKTPHKVYKIAMLTPEVRFWAIEHTRWHGMYVGIFGGIGLYDFHNHTNGHRGEGFMAGVSAGYMWPVGKHLSLDAELGLGFLRCRDKVYTPRDGHYLYQLTRHVSYFGPLRVKLSLVWRF